MFRVVSICGCHAVGCKLWDEVFEIWALEHRAVGSESDLVIWCIIVGVVSVSLAVNSVTFAVECGLRDIGCDSVTLTVDSVTLAVDSVICDIDCELCDIGCELCDIDCGVWASELQPDAEGGAAPNATAAGTVI